MNKYISIILVIIVLAFPTTASAKRYHKKVVKKVTKKVHAVHKKIATRVEVVPALAFSPIITPPVVPFPEIPTPTPTPIIIAPPVLIVAPVVPQVNNQRAAIVTQCDSEINSYNQQIIDLKRSYYQDLFDIESRPGGLTEQNGEKNLLFINTNTKIDQIKDLIQQKIQSCQFKLNNLIMN